MPKVSSLQPLVIVQARMGSTRLPGKVLEEVMEKPLLSYLVERLRRLKSTQNIVIATTTNPNDQAIVDFCHFEEVPLHRGSEENVLERYYQAAKNFETDTVVRITADCPLIDPLVVDKVINYYSENFPAYDYVSNSITRTFPRGMDVEVFSFKSLEAAHKEASLAEEKEHVTPFIYRRPNRFKIGSYVYPMNESQYRWTVDTAEDFELVSKILEALYPMKKEFTLEDILALLKKHPEWSNINAHIKQKYVEPL